MPSTFFHPLIKANQATLSASLALLQQAEQAELRIAKTYVTRALSFAQLAQALQLFAGYSGKNDDDGAQRARITKVIGRARLPSELTHELHQLYHQNLNAGFARLHCWTPYGTTPWLSEIKGDVNLADSLVAAWTAAIELNTHHSVSLVEAVTNCHAVIQWQPTLPIACGEIFTRHPVSGENQLLVIRLWPGAPHQTLENETPTQYAVDIRTGLIVQRQIGISHRLAKRLPDKVAISQQVETAEFLDEKEILELAAQIHRFKRRFGQQLHAKFEVEENHLIFTAFDEQVNERHPLPQPKYLLTKVYIATGSADSLDITAHENSDGIGLLRAEYIFSRLEVHPLSLIRKGRSDLITERLKQFLSEADHSYPDRRILYRLQNFTTQELAQFKQGESVEKVEPNPYLGWRGGLRLMEQPELFEPELTAFATWLKRRHAPTGLIVPFVRSVAEWRWIINRWKQRQFFAQAEFENWFQITTPENISNLEGYVLPEVQGVTLNLRTVTALMSGVDPDDAQLQASYPPPIELQVSVLTEVSQRIARLREHSVLPKLQLHLHLEDFNHLLVTNAVKLRYDGVVLNPEALMIGRSCVGVAEQENLTQISLTS